MQISPMHIAGFVLAGGLGTGGYFFYQSVRPSTLEDHLRTLNVDLLTKDWQTKEENYKKASDTELIPNIPKGDGKKAIENFARDLQNWCEKKKTKYFLGDNDPNYIRFSLWCTTTKTVKQVLDGRNLKDLSSEQQQEKVNAHNLLADGEKFITPKTPKTPKPAPEDKTIVVSDLTSWCDKEKSNEYKYEGFGNLKKVIEWCYA